MFGFNKYHYSFIYKIVCLDPNIDDIYIGSTISLTTRCLSHMRNTINKTHKIYHRKFYTFIRDSGGYENWEMQVIKQFKCETRKELLKEEQKYIDELKPSLNTGTAFTTEEEKEKQVKKWYQDNKEKLIKKSRKWHQDNKEKQNAKAKIYRQDNKEKMKELNYKWYQENKERQKEKAKVSYNCECGSIINKCVKARHNRTEKHQAYLNNLST